MASGTSLPPGGCTIVVSITSTTPGTVTNTTGTLSTAGGTAPPASAPITVSAGAASLAKTIAPGYILPGGAATLTITLGSSGAVPLVLVGVTTSTPGTTTIVTSALSAGGYRAGRIGANRHVRPASGSAGRFAARSAADGDARRDRRRRLRETATREVRF